MYTMVMMMAMSGSPDSTSFGGKLFGGRSGCNGTTISSHHGSSYSAGCSGYVPTVPAPSYGCSGSHYAPADSYGYGCSGSHYAPSYGCSGSHYAPSTGCTGASNSRSGFLGLRDCFKRKSSGCTGYSAPAYTGCTGYSSSAYTGCTGYSSPAYSGCTGYSAPVADCGGCGVTTSYSTGCVGSVVTGGMPSGVIHGESTVMPGNIITETPATRAKEMPKTDAPKVLEKKADEKKKDGI